MIDEKLERTKGREGLNQISSDLVMYYGNIQDGIIESAVVTIDEKVVEVGAYFGDIKPKNIIGISSQAGCASSCGFCEYGSEPFVRDLTADEMLEQVILMQNIMQQFGVPDKRIKVSVAKSGEPLFNDNLVEGLERIGETGISYKVSTVFPDSKKVRENLERVSQFGSEYKEPVQLQISVISTSEEYRKGITGIKVASLAEIEKYASKWKEMVPDGRDVNLSFIVSNETPCCVEDIEGILSPELFRLRFRNYVPTQNGNKANLAKVSEKRLEEIKDSFRQKGYFVTDSATPTQNEFKFGLAANVTRNRYLGMIRGEM